MMDNPTLKCLTLPHIFSSVLALSMLIIWAFYFPYLLTNRIKGYLSSSLQKRFSKDMLNNTDKVIKRFSSGYKEKVYFWEFIIYMRKLVLIFVKEFAKKVNEKIMGPTILTLLIIFYVANSVVKPYENNHMTNLENTSIGITIFTTVMYIIVNEYDF